MSNISAPFFNSDRIIRELRKHVAKSTIRKLKRGKIDRKEIVTGVLLAVLESHLKGKKPKRKNFSSSTKKDALERQGHRCNICGEKPDTWEYDHINGDSSDSSLENCQALCPNCHSRKTRHIEQKRKKIISRFKISKIFDKKTKKEIIFLINLL